MNHPPVNHWVQLEPRVLTLSRVTDVAVTGGTVAAVAAALGAAECGARVLLAAPRLFVGEDLCGTLQLWRDTLPDTDHPLLRRIYDGHSATTPLRVKRILTEQLLAAGVEVLLGCLPVGLIENDGGKPAGLVLANRAGRQAVGAKTLIDGGMQGLLSRLATASAMAFATDKETNSGSRTRVVRIVVGGANASGTAAVMPAHTIAHGAREGDNTWDAHVYKLDIDVNGSSPASMAEGEQMVRDRTFRRGQKRASESLCFPEGYPGWRSGVGDIPWVSSEAAGWTAGRQAAGKALAMPELEGLRLRLSAAPGSVQTSGSPVVLRERLNGLRPTDQPRDRLPAAAELLPVLAEADVIVVGGGTAGAAAAIAAAREGSKVLVVEFQNALGGVGTVGLIGKPYYGLPIGFARGVPFVDNDHGLEDKAEWLWSNLRAAGGCIWLGSLAYGAWMSGDRICGVAVATPYGHGLVRGNVVIDATGNAEIAAVAGATVVFGDDGDDIAIQGDGLSLHPLSRESVNSDFLLVDDSDVVDVSSAVLGATLAVDSDAAFDIAAFVQTRERRRMVGDFVMTLLDQLLERTYPDTVVMSHSDYDAHGYPSHPYFTLLPHTPETRKANHPAPAVPAVFTPYRCLLPRGIENLLVAGIGISMHRDASAMVRMQRDMLNQGYAVGLAAVMAVQGNVPPRQIDVAALQRRLVREGALPESVLSYTERAIPTVAETDHAVATYVDDTLTYETRSHALALLFRYPEVARSRAAVHELGPTLSNRSDARLALAKLQGMLGDPAGVEELIVALGTTEFDARILQGGMAEFAHLPTPMDALILSLGFAGDLRAVEPILRKLEQLRHDMPLSHHRAVALALERLADSRAAAPLAAKLGEPGMSGHVMTAIEPLYNQPVEKRRREGALREIVLARALFHCGDCEGIGARILSEYRSDVRGLFAQHAAMVLAER